LQKGKTSQEAAYANFDGNLGFRKGRAKMKRRKKSVKTSLTRCKEGKIRKGDKTVSATMGTKRGKGAMP